MSLSRGRKKKKLDEDNQRRVTFSNAQMAEVVLKKKVLSTFHFFLSSVDPVHHLDQGPSIRLSDQPPFDH